MYAIETDRHFEVNPLSYTFESLQEKTSQEANPLRLYTNVETDGYAAHWHNAIEMIMPVEEDYTVKVGGAQCRLHPGEILIIPSGVVHEIITKGKGTRHLFLMEPEDFFAVRGITRFKSLLFPFVLLGPDADGETLRHAQAYYTAAVGEYTSGNPLGEAAAQQWLSLMLISVIRGKLEGRGEEGMPQDSKQVRTAAAMMDVCSYIAAHCNEKLTLDAMAEYSGYSRYHFSRVFRTYTGYGFYDYFLLQRMALCRTLLANSALSITEVALNAGFGSLATFNRVFKQAEGMPPSQYRRIQQHLGDRTENGSHSAQVHGLD